jgi:hypothetical protein
LGDNSCEFRVTFGQQLIRGMAHKKSKTHFRTAVQQGPHRPQILGPPDPTTA